MLRAVVDTNITVSGLLFGGVPLKVIKAAFARKFVWVTSPHLMDETERVLRSLISISCSRMVHPRGIAAMPAATNV